MGDLLAALRAVQTDAAALLLVLCSRGELTVGATGANLGQSQPRVSRHFELLCELGCLTVFARAAGSFTRSAPVLPRARWPVILVAACTEREPPVALDLQRLAAIKRQRAERAAAYFSENAPHWDRIRSLYIDEREVEAVLAEIVAAAASRDLLDIGTGTGRMIEVLAPLVGQALGIDQSREMLAFAQVNLERAGVANGMARLGDMYQLPLPDASFDAVVIHQVLHYADRPAAVIAEAARVLRQNGLLIVVDFAPHPLEYLRTDHAHHRLGFADAEIAGSGAAR